MRKIALFDTDGKIVFSGYSVFAKASADGDAAPEASTQPEEKLASSPAAEVDDAELEAA